MPRPDFAEIPLIDIAGLRAAARDGVDEVAARIAEACETAGFFYVTGHGVPDSTIAGVFEAARWVFASHSPCATRLTSRPRQTSAATCRWALSARRSRAGCLRRSR